MERNWNEEAEGHIIMSNGLRVDLVQTIETFAARLKRDHATISAQAATIAKLTEHNALLRAEVRARRAERKAFFDDTPADEWKQLACKVYTAEAATDAAGAMG